MFYPVAVDGQMPYVDQKAHREQQIRRVIQKHRSRMQGDAKNNKQSSYKQPLSRQNSPRFISLDQPDSGKELKLTKTNILHAIKQWFTKSKAASDPNNLQTKQYTPRFHKSSAGARSRSHSAPVDMGQPRKTTHESNSPPGVSPKRRRTRTISNISSIMETIEEIPEGFVVEDETDSSDCSSSDSDVSSRTYSSNSSSLERLLEEVNDWTQNCIDTTSVSSSTQELTTESTTTAPAVDCST